MNILKNEKGFTLIELVLIIVILGILGAIATVQFGTLIRDSNIAALDAAPGPYNAQLALAVNTLKKLPTCNTEFPTEVFDKVGVSGGKVTSALASTCGSDPGPTDVTFTINGTCTSTWRYTTPAGSFTRTAFTTSGC